MKNIFKKLKEFCKKHRCYSYSDMKWSFEIGISEGMFRENKINNGDPFEPSDLDYYIKVFKKPLIYKTKIIWKNLWL